MASAAVDSGVQNLLKQNEDYASTYQAPPTFADLKSGGPPPNPLIAIISCCDSRLIPEDYFKFGRGEHFVIRNAGARAEDAIRSLIALDNIIGIGTVVIIQHTDCGLTHVTDDDIRGKLKEKAPSHSNEIDRLNFGQIKNLEQSIKDDVAFVKNSAYFKADLNVHGYLFNLAKGTMEQIV